MDWLAEFFRQKTATINLSLWAYPPLALGPDGPVAPQGYCLPYPGVPLAYVPASTVERDGATWTLPAHYRTSGPLVTHIAGPGDNGGGAPALFRTVAIYAPSPLNEHALVRINDTFAFVPLFSADGAPGFTGTSFGETGLDALPPSMKLPWTFDGYVTI
ncbi:hypothetical protein [Paraburkholderia caballeronis]|uniref:hypothetical protein n=1 Tax=Paraburkholderia caballeronis TaxID=416943 RepID=UPI001066AD57|nr:hypothetical protein [Paraburkholderia caballeronis]TDV03067.1 hypothetical protein C7408_13920 [Paraburkholderia caballeronis]TDV08389.1 hypothetical protein C7406_12920 [Paraburkholderia caballeronis]TDV19746.1 hypothetical protein C7404_12620 [Paraburkholderia caballeronis]TDV33993.1 hypothetical protein C7405_10910 [Paraburkholderia caballeronis]